jgi:translation initiation factor IF-1
MPNLGGKKNKKHKSGRKRFQKDDVKLDVANGEGFYCDVVKILGDNRVLVTDITTGTEMQVIIPGRMRKKQWINKNSRLLANSDHEIVSIIRESNKIGTDSFEKSRKSDPSSNIFNDNNDDSDSDDDININFGIKPVKPQNLPTTPNSNSGSEEDSEIFFDDI